MMVTQFSSPNDLQGFDIRNFADKLTAAKEKNKFICPNCDGHNLSIDMNTGEYQCFNGCECKDIREAIKPWSEVVEERKQGNYKSYSSAPIIRRKAKTKNPKPAPIPSDISIGTLPNPVAAPEITSARDNLITKYPYSPTQWVNRTDKPDGSKVTIPYHINSNGETVKGKGKGTEEWTPYRLDEIIQHGARQWVLGVEGEKCADAARANYQLLSFTFQGAAWGDKSITQSLQLLKNAGIAGVIYWPDHDDTGYSKAKKCSEAAAKIGLPFVVINPLEIWAELPEKGDIADFVEAIAMTGNDLAFLLQVQIKKAAQIQVEEEEELGSSEEKFSFCQIAFNHLYSDNDYICAANKLYKWDDNHYKLVSDGSEKRRIRDFCNIYSQQIIDPCGATLTVYPFAKTGNVEEALKWAKTSFHIDLDQINPSGLNCLNGILQIVWDGDKPSWELVPHSPDYFYTYPPLVDYNPNADSKDCDRLLDALDAPQREIFLKAIAASLDLPNIRKYKGRLIRALLLRGTGSNGKDALREAISLIFGKQGVTSATLSDFQQYDDGRRFPLSNLVYSRINWASENTNSSRLDSIQSLKAAITGDPLVMEAKGKDGQEFSPNSVFLFNINDVPNMQGSLEAILSRYGVLDFKKTYKHNADPTKGELEADPRFKYDPLFLRLMVCPALLNRLLESLKDLMINGIDYSCTQEALENIQSENSHLFQFTQDAGLSYDPNGYVSASDIWTQLEQWYINNGTLTYEETSTGKQKAIWADQVRYSDRNVKAVNQVLARFKQLFPKAKLATIPHPNGKKLQQVLQGITFSPLSIGESSTPISNFSTPIPPQFPPQETLTNQGFHPNHPQFSYIEEKNQIDNQINNQNHLLQSQNQVEDSRLGDGWGGTPIKQGFDGVVAGVVTGVENNLIGVENNLIENENYQTGDRVKFYPNHEHAVVDGVYIESVNKSDDQDTENLTSDTDDTPSTNVNKIDRVVPENPMNQGVDVDDTPSTVSSNHKVGDKVMCYPTLEYAERKKQVKATILDIQYSGQYLRYCDVEYLDKKGDRQKATIGGGSSDWLLKKVR